MCNYHVYTKSHVSDFPQNKKQLKRSYTRNIRHGLKINILVNKYSENIFPFMKCVCYTGTEIYTDWFLAFFFKTFVIVMTENNYILKKY